MTDYSAKTQLGVNCESALEELNRLLVSENVAKDC
jgi:hypothetical protein